jgi:hypothetical protein
MVLPPFSGSISGRERIEYYFSSRSSRTKKCGKVSRGLEGQAFFLLAFLWINGWLSFAENAKREGTVFSTGNFSTL